MPGKSKNPRPAKKTKSKAGKTARKSSQKQMAHKPKKMRAINVPVGKDGLTKLDKKGLDTLLALVTNRTYTAAAKDLGISRSSLYERIDRYSLEKHLEALPATALERLNRASVIAADQVVDIAKAGHNERNRLTASMDILDRVGIVPPKQAIEINIYQLYADHMTKERQYFELR